MPEPSAPIAHVNGLDAHTPEAQAESKSVFARPAVRLARNLVGALGVTAFVVCAVTNSTLNAAITSAASKVAAGFSSCNAYVAAHMGAFAGGAVAIGAMNLLDGVMSYRSARKKAGKLCAMEYAKPQAERGSQAYQRLRKAYNQMTARGALQTAMGITAITVGALALAGAMSNPIGLGVVLGLAVAIYVGVQVHKWYVNREIKRSMAEYTRPTAAPA